MSLFTTIRYNNIINNKYSIIKYPEEAKIIDLTLKENSVILNNIETIFQTNQNETNGDLLFFSTIASGNYYLPDPKSTLSRIEPGETYFIISKNTATYPVVFPGFPDSSWFSKYVNSSVLTNIKNTLKIESSSEEGGLPDNSKTKILLSTTTNNISWAKLAETLYEDIKQYDKNKIVINNLAAVLYDFQEYYKTYSIECVGLLNSVYKHCNSIQLNGYLWNSLGTHRDSQLDPVVIVNSDTNGSIKLNFAYVDPDIFPISISISGLTHQPNNKITYNFRILDSSHSSEIFPESGVISTNTTQNVINFRTLFNFLE